MKKRGLSLHFLRTRSYQFPLHFLIAFATALLVKTENIQLMLNGELINPDSYMRLVRIQEALNNGFWFANVVTRNESGLGTLIYWSHFVDGFILILRLPLLCFMSSAEALFWAGALSGPILLGLLGMACAWAVTPWLNKQWSMLVAVVVAISVPLLNYGQIGVATHHLMIVIWVVLGWGLVARSYLDISPIYGLFAGITAGLAIWVSPEATPYCLLGFGGILFLNMLEEHLSATQSAVYMSLSGASIASALYGIGFLLTIAFAFKIDPPYQGLFSPELDRVSITFLALAFFMFVASLVPALLCKLHCPRINRLFFIPCSALLGLVGWLYLFPAYLRGLNGLMSPEEASAFFITTEMAPINTVELFLYFGFTGLLSFLVITWLALTQAKLRLRWAMSYLGFGSLVCVCFAFWHVRFAIYSAAISAMTLGVLLTRLSDRGELKTQNQRVVIIFVYLILPVLLGYSYKAVVNANGGANNHSSAFSSNTPLNCSLKDAVRVIKPLGDVVVLADANIGPALLYKTQAKIVGSFYHAGIKGYMRLNAAWASTYSHGVPSVVLATKAKYILMCPMHRPNLFLALEGNTPEIPSSSLWEQLNSGRVPTWLSVVSSSTSTGWVLYQIQDNP